MSLLRVRGDRKSVGSLVRESAMHRSISWSTVFKDRLTCQEALTGRWFDSSSPIGLSCSRWTSIISLSRVHRYQHNGYIHILFSFVLPFSERDEAVLVVSSRYISTDRAAQHSSTRLRQANSRLNLRHILVSLLLDPAEWLSCRSCLLYSFSWLLSVVNCSRPLLIWLNYWRQKSAWRRNWTSIWKKSTNDCIALKSNRFQWKTWDRWIDFCSSL